MERDSKKWLNLREAAQHISMSAGFIRKAVRQRTIPYSRVGSKALRFDREALDAWMRR
jgi:excisionase family DNA binding protein